MRFGLILSSMYPLAGSSVAYLAEWLEALRRAREYPFDAIFVGQHYLHDDLQMFQPLPLLARACGDRGHLKVGSAILLLPLHHPVDVAEQFATLDVLAGGNLIVGVGMGYREIEFTNFGIDRRARVGRFVEALECVKRLWAEDTVDHAGRHFTLKGASINPKPVQRPRPPIWIAAHSDAAVRRAAALGDAWLMSPHSALTTLEEQVSIYGETRRAAGLGRGLWPLERETHIAATMERARAEARPSLEAKYQGYVRWGQEKEMPAGDRLDVAFEELARQRFLIGDPEHCIAQIEAYRKRLGIEYMIFHIRRPGMPQRTVLEQIDLLGREVLPHFQTGRRNPSC